MGDENSQDGTAQRTKKFVAENLRKLFLGGIGPTTNEEALAEYFSKWSALEDSCVLRDPKTKKSKGFAFVIFPEPEVVDEIMAARPHRIDGRNVEVKRPVPSEDVGRPESTVQSTKIFVGAIKEEMTEADIEEHFAKFGAVVSVALVNDRGTGKKRGFGFVQFADHDFVDKCLLYRHEHRIKDKWIDVKKALSKAELAEVAKKAEEAKARQQAAKRAAAEAAREEAEAKRAALAVNANRGPPMGGPTGPQGPNYQVGQGGFTGGPSGPVSGGGDALSWGNRNAVGQQGPQDGGMGRNWDGPSGDNFGPSGDGFGTGQGGWDNNRPQQGNWQGGGGGGQGGPGPDMGGPQGGRGPVGGGAGGGGGGGWGACDEGWDGPMGGGGGGPIGGGGGGGPMGGGGGPMGGGGGGGPGGASRPGMMGPNRYSESPAPRGPGGPGRNFDGPGGPGRNFDGPGGPGRNFDGPAGPTRDFDGPGPGNFDGPGPGPNRPFNEAGGGFGGFGGEGGFGGDEGPGANFDNRNFSGGPPRGEDWEGMEDVGNNGPGGGGGNAGGGGGGRGGRGGWNGPRGGRGGGGPRGAFNRNQPNPRGGRGGGGGGGFRGRF